jgi:cyclopropane fatty-acyl-phospholipid synthase-like methyltransferase
MEDRKLTFFTLQGRATTATEYSGIPECALPGQHAAIFKILSGFLKSSSRVIDLASGRGAWAKRLADAGYTVTATELHPEICRVPCIEIDLNEPFSKKFNGEFDAVTSIEMLEHIENPRHILRESSKLLRDGGILVLSTPNASGVHSRVKFLFTGKFAQFDEEQYQSIGHITPISHWQLTKMLDESGFEIQMISFHNHYTAVPKTVGEVIKKLATVLVAPLMRGVAGGQAIIVVAKKVRDANR